MTDRLTNLSAREIADSRGEPTLEITLQAGELTASAEVPEGRSRGLSEAAEVRDQDGHGVKLALERFEKILTPALLGMELEQKLVDENLIELDGTKNKAHLGGNVMVGVSMALARLIALSRGVPLWRHIASETSSAAAPPRLFMNVINGGVHAGFCLPFQEHMVVLAGASPREAFAKGNEIFDRLGVILEREKGEVSFGDEGGYAPSSRQIFEPFEYLTQAIDGVNDVSLAVDAAASELYKDDVYKLLERAYSKNDLLSLYKEITNRFALESIEDPFEERDFESFATITQVMAGSTLIVGDDLTVTNPRLLTRAIERKAVSGLIVKPNQIGTLTEVYEVIRLAREANVAVIVSHRSGDTEDSFIADLAFGVGAYGLKAGSPRPPERRAKYERLIEITEKEVVV